MLTFNETYLVYLPVFLILGALEEKFIKRRLRLDYSKKAILILQDDEPVGFFTPKITNGYYRVLYLYVDPVFRGKGIGVDVVKHFTKDIKSKAWIDYQNIASQKTFERAGFKKTEKEVNKKGKLIAYIYYKED
jgi:ribosomal protein S18 acetylase RimI-like enzyme